MTTMQGKIEDQNIAQRSEQMFPRRRLYRTMIMNTGIEVINTASKMNSGIIASKQELSTQAHQPSTRTKRTDGKNVNRYECDDTGTPLRNDSEDGGILGRVESACTG
jgi:hypothetical protein